MSDFDARQVGEFLLPVFAVAGFLLTVSLVSMFLAYFFLNCIFKPFFRWLFTPAPPSPECEAVLKALEGEGWKWAGGGWIEKGKLQINWELGCILGCFPSFAARERRLIRDAARRTLARLIGGEK